ncbi:hypothetical protein [Paenibacillus sp. FSL H8-0034]|uniref:hypothetical protein n=1 Tax=Paenibacillus sp. FSL H8-0034 TaxID=2954671 RepID=UPI0030F82FB6
MLDEKRTPVMVVLLCVGLVGHVWGYDEADGACGRVITSRLAWVKLYAQQVDQDTINT